MRILLVLFLSFGLYADNEIYIDQTGDNGAIDIEQLGSTNIIGGADAVSGQMTAAILNGGSWVFDINQIGSSNKFLTDGIYGDNFTGFFEFDGDSNEFIFSMDTTGLNSADFGDLNLDVTGSSNTFDVTQSSTLAADWLKIEGDASNSNICIVQNDGGTTTSC